MYVAASAALPESMLGGKYSGLCFVSLQQPRTILLIISRGGATARERDEEAGQGGGGQLGVSG